jgi:acetyl-CoA acetyltransferase
MRPPRRGAVYGGRYPLTWIHGEQSGGVDPTPNQERIRRLADEVAVSGVGETDYAEDYRRTRAGERFSDGYAYAATAFKRALADAGLTRDDIDGLIVGPTLAYERTAEVLGLEPRWAAQGDAVNAVFQGVLAITSGLAECVALVYGNDQRSAGTAYGGPEAMGGEAYLSYVYYAPWGMTSQGALYGMMTRRYMETTGFTEADLGHVAVAERRFASLNPRAIMRKPITLDDYLAAAYIAEPLRLYDYCLINDGGVSLILTTAERARKHPRPTVTIAALARADENVEATSLRPRLIDFYHGGHDIARRDLYDMAGIGPEDVDALQVYDSFSCHVVYALEGFGFCPRGQVGRFLREDGIGPGQRLPTNTGGGHLSETYMQGWNHQVEAVRQVRGESGERQVANARHVQYISDVAGKTLSVIYRRTDV